MVDPVLGARDRWHMLHSDPASSDEVSIALAPVFEADWHTEPATFHVTVPVFDAAGNLYVVPFLPHENVTLISLDPSDGARRWSIPGTGAPAGGVAPMVLNDPASPGSELVYVTLYDRAFAARTDGTLAWDVGTGLTLTGTLSQDAVLGNSYLPQRNAIAGLTGDGHLYLLNRETGAQILAAPFSLPGSPSPAGPGLTLPPDLIASVDADLRTLINFPPGSTLESFLEAILGNSIEVSNSFSIDANSGRMWVAATAPDEADGAVDGISSLGSLYGLDVVDAVGGPEVQIHCRRDFTGGSASTPALRSDGTRIYVGDNHGNVIAVDADCNQVWSLDVGSQVTGSIAVSSDNDEIYVSTQRDIFKIMDNGSSATVAWTANLEVYQPGAVGQTNFNTLLAGIAANGVNFMAGVGIGPGVLANLGLPMKVGYGVLDRQTGQVRYFADGLDESVAEMDVGPDGAYYNSNSPVRRAFTHGLFPNLTGPIEGGIRKFAPRRVDLLLRDGLCAAADRAANADANSGVCYDSAVADAAQIGDLLAQTRRMGPVAVSAGDVTPAKWERVSTTIAGAESADLATQAATLARACRVFAPCDPTPRAGCAEAGDSRITMKRKAGAAPNVDSLSWKWSHGAAVSAAQLGDPTTDADYGVCVYVDLSAGALLAYESGVPASSTSWRASSRAASWSARSGTERGLRKLKVTAGVVGQTSVSALAKGSTYASGVFAVDPPVVVQLVNLDTNACWESRFEAADVLLRNGDTFKARTGG